jgi:hypothetical protein
VTHPARGRGDGHMPMPRSSRIVRAVMMLYG